MGAGRLCLEPWHWASHGAPTSGGKNQCKSAVAHRRGLAEDPGLQGQKFVSLPTPRKKMKRC